MADKEGPSEEEIRRNRRELEEALEKTKRRMEMEERLRKDEDKGRYGRKK